MFNLFGYKIEKVSKDKINELENIELLISNRNNKLIELQSVIDDSINELAILKTKYTNIESYVFDHTKFCVDFNNIKVISIDRTIRDEIEYTILTDITSPDKYSDNYFLINKERHNELIEAYKAFIKSPLDNNLAIF